MQTRQGWRKTLEVDFVDGMNTLHDPHFLRGEAFDILRNERRLEGSIDFRPGWTKVHNSAMPMQYCVGGICYLKRDDTQIELVVGGDSKVYRTNTDPPGALTQHNTFSWNSDNAACLAQWRDDCYICMGNSGSTLNLRYDATSDAIFTAGMPAPSAPTAAEGAAGDITGTRYYRVVFRDTVKARYSAPGTSVAVTVEDKKVDLAGIATYAGEVGGTGRTIHREIQVSDDDATWRVLTRLEDDTTTATTDSTSGTLTSLALADEILENVPLCKFVISTPGGLMFWANDVTNNLPARIYRSADPDSPEYRAEAYLDVGDSGEPITGLARWGDGILVAKLDSLHYVPLDVSRSHCLLWGVGAVSHNGLLNIENGLAFPGKDGIRYFNGQTAPFVGKDKYGPGSGARAFPLRRTWRDDVTASELGHCFAAHFPSKGLAVWYFRTGSTCNYSQRAIWWDYRRNELGIDDFTAWQAWDAPVAGSRERRVHACFPKGFVGRLEHGVGDGAGEEDFVHGATAASTATTLTTDKTDLSTTGDGHKGVRLHIWDGTGVGQKLFVSSNDGSKFWFDGAGGSLDDGSFTTLPIAGDSKWMLGWREGQWRVPGIRVEEPGVVFRASELQLHMLPSTNT